MDYQTKREMILRAYKWREDNKKKSDDEFYAQVIIVFMFIITLNHIYYMYKNFELIHKNNQKLLEINSSNQECSKSEQYTSP